MRFVCSRSPSTPDFAGDGTVKGYSEGGESEPLNSGIVPRNAMLSLPRVIFPKNYAFLR